VTPTVHTPKPNYPGHEEVAQWLSSIGMQRYVDLFAEQELDMQTVRLLDRKTLQTELGIEKIGPLTIFENAINDLNRQVASSSSLEPQPSNQTPGPTALESSASASASASLLMPLDEQGDVIYESARSEPAPRAPAASNNTAQIAKAIPEEAFVVDVVVGRRLGGGHFGDVYSGVWQDCISVALKRVKAEGDKGLAEFQAELTVLMQQRHPNIVTCYGM
jgi:hypothetical protein